MDPVSFDFTNNFGKMHLLVALLTHLLTTGGTARHVIHGIVGCLVLLRYQKYGNMALSSTAVTIKLIYLGFDPFVIFKLLDLSHYLLDESRIYAIAKSSRTCRTMLLSSCNTAGVFLRPKGITLNAKNHLLYANAVFSLLSSSSYICQ